MARVLAMLYGVICYLLFLAVFVYAIGFVGNVAVPKSIDSGAQISTITALLIDAVLLSLFAIQHSVMARQWFKRGWTKIVPWPVERSTYVLFSSAVLALLLWQWRPVTAAVWDVQAPSGQLVLKALFFVGWGILLFSTWLIDHFELFGVRQVFHYAKGVKLEAPAFKTPSLYKFVRHPLYLGFLVAFWSTPHMTVGHLFFSIMTTGYILLAIQFEERDLLRFYGEAYRQYRQRVSMIIPLPPRKLEEPGARSDAAPGSR
jgi:protein-S-isoprenylcysteine O-methyltransferase Ste14